jgi:hypothetical protein
MDVFRTSVRCFRRASTVFILISTKIQASSTFSTPANSMKNTVVRPISRLHFKTGSSRQVLTRGVADHRCSCRAASRSALPRLHAGFLAPLHAHKRPRSCALFWRFRRRTQRTDQDPGCMRQVPPRSRGLPHTRMPAHVAPSRATYCRACMRVPPHSRGLPRVCMSAHAYTSPALNSCPSVCRQHTGPGPCRANGSWAPKGVVVNSEGQ